MLFERSRPGRAAAFEGQKQRHFDELLRRNPGLPVDFIHSLIWF
jgi:hypothetical protein